MKSGRLNTIFSSLVETSLSAEQPENLDSREHRYFCIWRESWSARFDQISGSSLNIYCPLASSPGSPIFFHSRVRSGTTTLRLLNLVLTLACARPAGVLVRMRTRVREIARYILKMFARPALQNNTPLQEGDFLRTTHLLHTTVSNNELTGNVIHRKQQLQGRSKVQGMTWLWFMGNVWSIGNHVSAEDDVVIFKFPQGKFVTYSNHDKTLSWCPNVPIKSTHKIGPRGCFNRGQSTS